MSFLRNVAGRVRLSSTLCPYSFQRPSTPCRVFVNTPYARNYATKRDKKDKKDKKRDTGDDDAKSVFKVSTRSVDTNTLVPGSQKILAGEEYFKAEKKMQAVVDRFRNEAAKLELRASGRVTPVVLEPVRVVLPHTEGRGVRLEEIATVGVRDGTTLIITAFEESVSNIFIQLFTLIPLIQPSTRISNASSKLSMVQNYPPSFPKRWIIVP